MVVATTHTSRTNCAHNAHVYNTVEWGLRDMGCGLAGKSESEGIFCIIIQRVLQCTAVLVLRKDSLVIQLFIANH